jgi:hypothetical protein
MNGALKTQRLHTTGGRSCADTMVQDRGGELRGPAAGAGPAVPGGQKSRLFNYLLIAVYFLVFTVSPAWAAPASESKMFQQLLADLHLRLADTGPSDLNFPYQDLFRADCEIPVDVPADGDILRAQSHLTGKMNGLELRGGYNSDTLTQGGQEDSGLDAGRGYLELSWDILKQGYRQNALRSRALELRAREADLQQGLAVLTETYGCRRNRIHKAFAHQLIHLLSLKLQLMEPVYRVERRAYFKHWSFLDDYLVSEEDLRLTRQELDTLTADAYYDDSPVYPSFPPLLDVDLAGLLSAVRQDHRYDEMLRVEKEWLRLEDKANVRNSLRVFVRQEFDGGGGSQNQDALVAGLRFRVPLHSRKKSVLQLKINRAEKENKHARRNIIVYTRDAYARMQAQLRQCVDQHYKQARAQERLRRTLWRVGKGDAASLVTAITRMRTLIDARLDLLRATEELYRRINAIFRAAQIAYHPDLVQTVTLKPERRRARPGTRRLYIWSKDFNRMKNEDLLAFLEAKQISGVLLSAGRKTNARKREHFLELLARNDINAELIVGDNDWISPDKQAGAVARSVVMAEKTGHIHFDIEPHTMADFPEKRHDYLSRLVDLVEKTKASLMDRTLSVAVPVHWPLETYRALGVISDKLYVMAYGTADPAVLIRRITPILKAVNKDKIVIVLRAEDFADEWEIERMIDRIISETAMDQFALHDLGGFLMKTASYYETED